MHVPLGILLRNPEFAKNKFLMEPLDMGMHLKLSAGTCLHEPDAGNDSPIIKIRNVFNRLTAKVKETGKKVFFDQVVERVMKKKMTGLNKNLDLTEQEVLTVNVSHNDDLDYPNGHLMKYLMTNYPFEYPEPYKKEKLSALIEHFNAGETIQLLNDIGNPNEDRLLFEYREEVNKSTYFKIRDKVNKLLQPRQDKELFDSLSSGETVAVKNLYTPHRRLVIKSGEPITDEIKNSPDWQKIIQPDPEILYRFPDSPQGILLLERDYSISFKIKTIIRKKLGKLVGETVNSKAGLDHYNNLNPKIIIIGLLDHPDSNQFNFDIIKTIKSEDSKKHNKITSFIALSNNEQTSNHLRNLGISFILDRNQLNDETENKLGSFLTLIQQSSGL